jgi:hypothetical protein
MRPFSCLLGVSFLPLYQMEKSSRSGSAVRRTHPRMPSLISKTFFLRFDMIARVHVFGASFPKSDIPLALNAAEFVHVPTACFASASVSSRSAMVMGTFGSTSRSTRRSMAL